MGQLDNTIIIFTTDNGGQSQTFPDGGMTPFKGQQAHHVGRWLCACRWSSAGQASSSRAPCKTEIFASLDWLPTLVDIAGGPKGNELKAQIEKGAYPGIVKTTLDGVNQREYLEGKSEKSARDYLLLLHRCAHRRRCGTRTGRSTSRWRNRVKRCVRTCRPQTYGWAQVQNIKRDPFEQAVGQEQKSVLSLGGALASPSTAYLYNWNMLPVGQQLWLKELQTYIAYPPLQSPESYNLVQVMEQVKKMDNSVSK